MGIYKSVEDIDIEKIKIAAIKKYGKSFKRLEIKTIMIVPEINAIVEFYE